MIAISYDPVSTLKLFTEERNITYPLLSDAGSHVIRAYGILNTQIDSSSKAFGIPNPGIYIIDKDLRVVDKQFEKSYAERPTAQSVLVARLGKQLDSNVRAFRYDYLTGTIGISDTVAYRSQVLAVLVDIEMAAGFHLYGKPIPKGYRPLAVTFEDNPNFAADAVPFPQTRRFEMESLGETFNLLPDDIHIETALRINNKPEFGEHVVKATISFQACDDKGCRFPEERSFEFPLRIAQ